MTEFDKYMSGIKQAADSLFKDYFGIDVEIMDLEMGITEIQSDEVSVLLGIVGDLKGQIICSFHEQTAKSIVGLMMGGIEVTEIDDMAWSAIQEFGNWIAGTTAVQMSKDGITVDATPPVLNKGISTFRSPDKFTAIKLQGIMGQMHVYVSLQDV